MRPQACSHPRSSRARMEAKTAWFALSSKWQPWSEGNAVAVSRHNAWKWEKHRYRPQRWIVWTSLALTGHPPAGGKIGITFTSRFPHSSKPNWAAAVRWSRMLKLIGSRSNHPVNSTTRALAPLAGAGANRRPFCFGWLTPPGNWRGFFIYAAISLLCTAGTGLDNIQSRCGPCWDRLPAAAGTPALPCDAYRSSTNRVRAPSASCIHQPSPSALAASRSAFSRQCSIAAWIGRMGLA